MGSDVDDALCLGLALHSPEIELVALTHVGNESGTRAAISQRLLQLAGRDDITAHAGCRVPVMGGPGFNWFGIEGVGIFEEGREPAYDSEHAVDALCRLFDGRDDLHLIAVGPLTNIAVALMKEPGLAGRVRSLTVMGGHIRRVHYGGHVFAPGVDYNLCSDPHAAKLVLRSGIPTRLVTADVTLETWITAQDLERIDAIGTPFHRALAEAVRVWTPIQNRLFSGRGCDMSADNVAFLHDPLTLACAHDPGFCEFETLEIEPEIEDGVFRTFERAEAGDNTWPMECATHVDAAAIRSHFVERLTAS